MSDPEDWAPGKEVTLGDRIKTAYLEAGLNRAEFCRKAGLDYSTVMAWEAGDRLPRMSSLLKVVGVTGVSLQWLTTGEGSLKNLNEPSPEPPTGKRRKNTVSVSRDRALHRFLSGPFGSTASDVEIRQMLSTELPGEPTEHTYELLLLAVRSAETAKRIDRLEPSDEG